MLQLSRGTEQAVVIRTPEGDVVVRVLSLRNGTVRLGLDGPREILIDRLEVARSKMLTGTRAARPLPTA